MLTPPPKPSLSPTQTCGAVIYYTTNGAVPTSASTKYTAPVAITQTTDFQTISIATGYVNSIVAKANYTLIGWPTGIVSPASAITTSSATLSAVANTLGLAGSYHFQYGLQPARRSPAPPPRPP